MEIIQVGPSRANGDMHLILYMHVTFCNNGEATTTNSQHTATIISVYNTFITLSLNTTWILTKTLTSGSTVLIQGQVKVIRRQPVYDVRTFNQNIFRCSRIEQIGCGRQFSHASGMASDVFSGMY